MKPLINHILFKITIVVVLFFIIVAFMQPNFENSDPQKDGYVPNAETAIKIAEAIWLPIYGKEIYDYKPFKAELIDGKVWKVYGTVHTDSGGSPFAKIQKSDCKIISVYHQK